MACYSQENSVTVQILRAETSNGVTEYVIEMRVSSIRWTVKHRYNNFYELHQTLISMYDLDKKLLPPKKTLGNTNDSFIQKRRCALEKYLQNLLARFQILPHCIGVFLDFHKYEVNCVTQTLADLLFKKGDILLAKNSVCSMDPLQLHSIQYRLVNPETVAAGGVTQDMGHVLDFIIRLQSLRVIGTDSPVGSSNLNINKLTFSINMFKNLKILEISNCDVTMLEGIDSIRSSLEKLKVKFSLKDIQDLLCNGEVYWEENSHSQIENTWNKLTWVDFSTNQLTSLHHSLSQFTNVDYLDLHDNYIADITHLDTLSNLRHIDLSNNRIKILNDLHIKLGNIKTLNLSGNQLESLEGFSKLYSLEYLDVRSNQISQLSELICVGNLPLITDLMFSGNPVNHIPDHRTRILTLFTDRAKEIRLDNEKASEKELDTVAVLLALDQAEQLGSNSMTTSQHSHHAVPSLQSDPLDQPELTCNVETNELFFSSNSAGSVADTVRKEDTEIGTSYGDQWLNMLNQPIVESVDSPSSSSSSQSFLSIKSSPDDVKAVESSQPIKYDGNLRDTDLTVDDCVEGDNVVLKGRSETENRNISKEVGTSRTETETNPIETGENEELICIVPDYISTRLKSVQNGSPNLLLARTTEELEAVFFNLLESSYKEERLMRVTWALDYLTKPARILITDQATYLASEENGLVRIKHSGLKLCRVEENLQCIELQPIDKDAILLYILDSALTQNLITELSKCLELFDAEDSERCSVYDSPLKSRIVTAFHYELQSDMRSIVDVMQSECYYVFLMRSNELHRLYISPEQGITIARSDIDSIRIENLSVLEVDRKALTVILKSRDVSYKLLFSDGEILKLAIKAVFNSNPNCYLSDQGQ